MEKSSLVILAAGNGTRLKPLTNTVPKPLLRIANKPALEYQMEGAFPYVDQIIIVVGYLQDEIKKYFGESYRGVPVEYVVQPEQVGNGQAMQYVKGKVRHESMLITYGDDIYEPELFQKIAEKQHATVGVKKKDWQNFGVFKLKEGNHMESIIEKPSEFVSDLVNIGIFKVQSAIFDYIDKIEKTDRGEYEVTDIFTLYAKDHPMEVVEAESGWIPLGYPWHILEATEYFLKKVRSDIQGTVEDGATLKGNVVVGKGSVIKAGTYIEGNAIIGENCVIGPNCYIKEFAAIGNGTTVGNAVEITRSVLGEHVNVRHLAYVGDSILGNNVNIAAGTVLTNLRHDFAPIKMMINDKLVDTGRMKLGAVLGDGVKTGAHTTIYPGRKIANNTFTMPAEIVKADKV